MMFLSEVLILCFVVFLYWVFVLAKDDFVLLRKNVSLEEMFNLSFFCFLVAVFFARLGFVLENPHGMYANPLIFLAFPYFPGLSLAAGVIGGSLFLWFYGLKKKFPQKRLLDVCGTSFLSALAVGQLCSVIITSIAAKKFFLLPSIAFLLQGMSFFVVFWLCTKSKLRDGSAGYSAFILAAFLQIVIHGISRGVKHIFFVPLEDILFLGIMVFFSILLFRNERKKEKKS